MTARRKFDRNYQSNHAHEEPITVLYRGANNNIHKNYTSETMFSTSYDLEMARNFGDYVYEFRPSSEDILFDTTILDPSYLERNGAFSDEHEVILLPGTYKVKLAE